MAIALPKTNIQITRAPLGVLILAVLVVACVLLAPVYLVWRAAQSNVVWEQLSDPDTVRAFGNTVLLTATVVASCVAIAVPAAWLSGRTDLPLSRMWTVLLALPLAVPSFVGGYVMVSALGPGGMAQDLLEPLGLHKLPSIYGFRGAWFVLTLLTYPYVFIQVRAALRRVDPALEEVSRSLGKGAWETFWRVNLPQLKPAISAGALLIALDVVSEFGAVSMLRFDTLTPLVYIEYTTSFNRAAAAALGLPLIGLALLFVLMEGMTRGRGKYYARVQRPARQLRLGRWRWPAFGFCTLVAGLGIGVPVGVVLYWLVNGISQHNATGLVGEGIYNSARASGMAAIGAALACLPIALLSVRFPDWLSSLLEKLSYAGHALPAITIALALVFFAANYVTPLYQTIWVLVFAYTVRFMPEALGATRGALLQVNPSTEEAARNLGAGPIKTFARITVPQIVPGASAGMVLVFLTAMKELPITILLSPIGFDTLATEIWASTTEAFFTKAALPSLMLLAISGAAVMLMLRRERLS